MSASLGWQYAVIAVLVAASAGFVLRRLAPQVVARWQHGAARALMQPARPRAMRWLGRRLMPKSAADGGCGDGCGTCGGCGAGNEAAPAEPGAQPLRFHPREMRRRRA
ncbi:hypothetical protein BZL54_20310 [Burkholderia ubonensis subsp. mesacidophila]|uniref:Uncharacterized protein n=1 Tax=Burkholderia ubonensis subsp. mesacidophila TaxID=265293 RepID=A0A2A4FD09_9BURK|nr:DUF6587 family protein [Burkholderia ubonensis]PCE30550.1 hypothetical protein BZL54_20310 [Burkholderia ubonensis subsp. mesacidophila]